jgi:orotate phosphoribosyltransferase
MILNIDTASKVAEFLLQIKAIKLNVNEPFTWASGIKSPIYCDNRVILSYPKIRTFFRQQLVDVLQEAFGKPDVIAGVATGGIPLGALVAQEMELPFAYVRSQVKEHGLQNMVEGIILPGQSVILIEDLISTGMSSLRAVNAVKDKNSQVKGIVSIFDYGFKIAIDNFEQANCPFYSLCNFDILIEVAKQKEYISKANFEKIMQWKKENA